MEILLIDSILRSILVGSLFTLIGIGVTQTVAVTKIFNFAHGELVTIGAYVACLITKFIYYPLNLPIAIISSFIVPALIILLIDEVVFKPLTRKGATSLMLMVASFAVSLGLRYSLYIITTSQRLLTIMSEISLRTIYTIGDGRITNLFLWAVPVTLASVLLLEFLFLSTKSGKAMRAVAENVSLARATGINVDYIRRLTWIISGGLAGIAGAFWSIYTQTNPEIGWVILLRGFAASTVGGYYSFFGTIVGGYLVGLSENLIMDLINRFFGISIMYKPVLTFALMISFLLFKPTGLVLEDVNLAKILKKIYLYWGK